MADLRIIDYATLKAALASWLNRSDLTDQIPVFVQLAENMFQRDIRWRKMVVEDRIVAPFTDEAYENLPGDFLELKSIRFNTTPPVYPRYLSPAAMENWRSRTIGLQGTPRFYTIVGNRIFFDRVPTGAPELHIASYVKIPRLTSVSNLVQNNFTKYWSVLNTPSSTEDAIVEGGWTLALVGDDSASLIEYYRYFIQPNTFASDGTKGYSFVAKKGPSSSSYLHLEFYDNTALTWRGATRVQFDAAGVPTVTPLNGGIHLSTEELGNGKYRFRDQAVGVLKANQHAIHAVPAANAASDVGNAYLGHIQVEDAATPTFDVDQLTNQLLLEYPDIYLFGSLIQAEPFLKNDERLETWRAQYARAVGGLHAADKRAQAGVSPAVSYARRPF